MLTTEIIERFRAPLSVVAATRSAAGRPTFTRGIGVRGEVGADRVTFFVPEITAAPMLADLEGCKEIAVQLASWADFRSLQVKGTVVEIRAAGPDAAPLIDDNTGRVVEVITRVIGAAQGAGWARFVIYPALAVTVRLREVFEQTPGPSAGQRLE